MKRIYLAARYSRRIELCAYRDDLRARGFEVTARWLDGTHAAIDGTAGTEQRGEWATDDLADIDQSEVLIAFTESPDSGHSRGGRHVELGYALAKRRIYPHRRIHVVGPVENVFCALPEIIRHDTWPQCLAELVTGRGGRDE